jgi:hypothetical protein
MRLLDRIAHEDDGDGRSSVVESIPVYREGGKQVISFSREKYQLRLVNHPFFPAYSSARSMLIFYRGNLVDAKRPNCLLPSVMMHV